MVKKDCWLWGMAIQGLLELVITSDCSQEPYYFWFKENSFYFVSENIMFKFKYYAISLERREVESELIGLYHGLVTLHYTSWLQLELKLQRNIFALLEVMQYIKWVPCE